MCMTRTRQRGFTLMELIIFTVIVRTGLAGILSEMNTVVKSSADPLVRKQAIAMAESIMEEITLQPYDDPDGLPGAGGRAGFDDVSDDNGQIQAAFTDFLPVLSGYTPAVTLAPPINFNSTVVKNVTATVSRSAESVRLTSYRASDAT